MLSLEDNLAMPHDQRPTYYGRDQVAYLDKDVLTAAKERIAYCLKAYDIPCVSYSGGKDSLVVLHLVREVMDELGMTQPLDVVFRDEELIPDMVIDFVLKLREEPEKWRLHYFAFPMSSHFFIFGEHRPYVQWDVAREGNWIRPKPEGAITSVHPDDKPLDQHDTNIFMNKALGWEGKKIAIFNGVRCQESLPRFMSCIAVKNRYNYIARNSGGAVGTDFVKVIYDWSEDDVFRYFFDRNIQYCAIYDLYMHASSPLRVATPLHDAGFQQLKKLRTTFPHFYEAILRIWPDADAQVRYWEDYEQNHSIDAYEKSWAGIIAYIDENITNPSMAARAKEVVRTVRQFKERNRRMGRLPDNCYGYPLAYVFGRIAAGKFQKGIPSTKKQREDWHEYERQAHREAEERRLSAA